MIRTGRAHSYWVQRVAGRVPDQVPQICAWLGLAGSALSLRAVTAFQPAVYEAVGVAMGAMLPLSGADRSAGMTIVLAVSMLPALSGGPERAPCTWRRRGAAMTPPLSGVHGPVPMAYSMPATPEG